MAPQQITTRAAQLDDAKMIWQWRNDAKARAMSLNTDEIPLAPHLEWFHASLANPNRAIIIAQTNQTPVGYVRFDHNDNAAVVSIALAPDARGKGLSKAILAQGLAACPYDTPRFIAQIKLDNAASLAIFEALGFRQINTEDNTETYELKRGKHD